MFQKEFLLNFLNYLNSKGFAVSMETKFTYKAGWEGNRMGQGPTQSEQYTTTEILSLSCSCLHSKDVRSRMIKFIMVLSNLWFIKRSVTTQVRSI
jgi:hypothetical protein